MRRPRLVGIAALSVATVFGIAARSTAGQQFPLLPPPPAFAPPPAPQPFGDLFGGARVVKAPPPAQLRTPWLDAPPNRLKAQPSRTIACGIKLVPAGPAFDPAIRRAVPENGPAFTMRTAPPPVCRQ